jgi:hypothetical protein
MELQFRDVENSIFTYHLSLYHLPLTTKEIRTLHYKNYSMKSILSVNWMLIVSAWCFINGLLHDIFIIRAHKGPYDRELLRLLMDGHLLIFTGILLFFSYMLTRSDNIYGPVTAAVLALSMIVYCIMIFPFLKSIVTLTLSVILLLVCVRIFAELK